MIYIYIYICIYNTYTCVYIYIYYREREIYILVGQQVEEGGPLLRQGGLREGLPSGVVLVPDLRVDGADLVRAGVKLLGALARRSGHPSQPAPQAAGQGIAAASNVAPLEPHM